MTDHDKRPPDRTSEHEDQKAGNPPRPATEPGGGAASCTDRTRTDPATGEDRGAPRGSEKV